MNAFTGPARKRPTLPLKCERILDWLSGALYTLHIALALNMSKWHAWPAYSIRAHTERVTMLCAGGEGADEVVYVIAPFQPSEAAAGQPVEELESPPHRSLQ